ncbi:MAG: FadR/GntR family transcriptional regulator [Anaerolineales bacterium]|jgi:GntR family transcriptional repressor for pyruvate dehydrogenase complex
MVAIENNHEELLEPIERNTLPEVITKQVLNLLASGVLKPGDKLPAERDLARQLNVGRTSVREALKLLTLSGLLEAKRGDGTYVRQEFESFLVKQIEWPIILNAYQVDKILEVRQPLEVQAAGLAAERATEEGLQRISRFRKMAEIEGRDIELETQLDLEFHKAIAAAAQNDLLFQLMNSMHSILKQYIMLSNGMTENQATTVEEHQRIYEAIKNGDPEAAKQAMVDHLKISKQLILKAFNHNSNNHLGKAPEEV